MNITRSKNPSVLHELLKDNVFYSNSDSISIFLMFFFMEIQFLHEIPFPLLIELLKNFVFDLTGYSIVKSLNEL